MEWLDQDAMQGYDNDWMACREAHLRTVRNWPRPSLGRVDRNWLEPLVT